MANHRQGNKPHSQCHPRRGQGFLLPILCTGQCHPGRNRQHQLRGYGSLGREVVRTDTTTQRGNTQPAQGARPNSRTNGRASDCPTPLRTVSSATTIKGKSEGIMVWAHSTSPRRTASAAISPCLRYSTAIAVSARAAARRAHGARSLPCFMPISSVFLIRSAVTYLRGRAVIYDLRQILVKASCICACFRL